MKRNIMEVLTDKNIKAFLEEAPLYVWYEFKAPVATRSSLWINAIDSFCEVCKTIRPFHDMRSRGGGAGMVVKALSTGESYFELTCVSCRKKRHEYLVEQVVNEETIKFQKYGQLPRKLCYLNLHCPLHSAHTPLHWWSAAQFFFISESTKFLNLLSMLG